MLRVFTKNIGVSRDGEGPRFPAGKTANWPVQTWKGIATTLGVHINDFSRPLEDAVKDWANPLPEVHGHVDPGLGNIVVNDVASIDAAPKPPVEPIERKKRGRKPGKASAQAKLKKAVSKPPPVIPSKEGLIS